MTIDRVARGMTAGRPRDGFTERVMAPIHGRPRPGFTARVMGRLDEPAAQSAPSVAQAFRPAVRIAFALAPVAAVIVAAVWFFFGDGARRIPTAPAAPRLTGMTHQPGPIAALLPSIEDRAIRTAPRVRISAQPLDVVEVLPPVPEIYTIAALDGPANIGLKPIGPEAPVIAPLEEPAPLKINEIKENKEKS